MSTKDEHSLVNQYRLLHRRCRTCQFASSTEARYGRWFCTAKMKLHEHRSVYSTVLEGCLCKLYQPKEY